MNNMNIDNVMEQIAYIKDKMNNLQQELESLTVKGQDKEGIITAVLTGSGQVIDYEFKADQMEVYNLAEIKEALVTATNDGLKKAAQIQREKRKAIVGNLNIPDIPGLF